MICPKCGSEVSEGSAFCTKCGAALGANAQQTNNGMPQGAPQPDAQQAGNGMPYGSQQMNNGVPPYGMPQQPYMDPKDHTAEFDSKDVSDNKVMAMLPYLMGTIGIIIALLASRESPYTYFHVRQAAKISVVTVLVGLITAVLCWTVIVPIAGGVCVVILLVVRIISFFQVCSGKAKEAAIVSSFGFLK
ncbi:MAG: zinc-ribbon domain-containing protein [Agathobacter sp.]